MKLQLTLHKTAEQEKVITRSKRRVGRFLFKINPFSRFPKKMRLPLALMTAALILLSGSTIYFERQLALATAPALSAEQKLKILVAEVNKTFVVPTDEMPTVATVSDPTLLKNQPFFANANVGDVILVYTTAKKAILWRPSMHKVVEVSSLNDQHATH
jgi:hypothetical protein